MRRPMQILSWLLQVLLSAMFLFVAYQKFAGRMWPRMFAHWGYPENSHLIVGAVEAAAAIGLLVPRTAALSAGVLLAVMAGAAMTHLMHGEIAERSVQLLVMILGLAAIVKLRWRDSFHN
jgi:uncharacterized membrane protein YphA (DoxX/SURF4 family)